MTSQTIRQAALRLFAQNGYDAVPLSDIAQAVGIKTPSLYAHFKSKDDLFLAVFHDSLQEHASRMKALIDGMAALGTEVKLRTIVQHASRSYLLDEERVTLLKRAMLFPPAHLQDRLRDAFQDAERQLDEALSAIFREGIASGLLRPETPEHLMTSFYCLLDGAFLQQFYYRPDDWEHKLERVWAIYWKGILNPHAL